MQATMSSSDSSSSPQYPLSDVDYPGVHGMLHVLELRR